MPPTGWVVVDAEGRGGLHLFVAPSLVLHISEWPFCLCASSSHTLEMGCLRTEYMCPRSWCSTVSWCVLHQAEAVRQGEGIYCTPAGLEAEIPES